MNLKESTLEIHGEGPVISPLSVPGGSCGPLLEFGNPKEDVEMAQIDDGSPPIKSLL